jgi:hypothetical protein
MSRQKTQRGGYREGSGRKPKFGRRMAPTSVGLPDSVITILDKLAKARGVSRSDVLIELLAKAHKPIRDVLKQK